MVDEPAKSGMGARVPNCERAFARVRAVADNRPSKPFGFDMGARVKDWKPFVTEVIPRLGVWLERRNCPLDYADLLDLLDYISHCWELRALRDVARWGAVVEAKTAGNQISALADIALEVFHRVLSAADQMLGYIAAHGRDGFDPEVFTSDELNAIVKSLPPAPNAPGKDLQDELKPFLLNIADGMNRQTKAVERLRRTVRGEDTAGRNGDRPRKPGAEKMILQVIQCAVDKLRLKRSHYADHIFRNWKGERPYISAHSLFTSTQRYLADNGLPELPTTADAQAVFVRAVNGNAVILRKLEAHKPR